jgi:ABC-type Fe3+/spermidine/putrescine transport system ATPase subunit
MLMDRGTIVQQGTPLEVYRQPTNAFAAKFMGLNNLINIQGLHVQAEQGHAVVETALGQLVIANVEPNQFGTTLLIRPEAATQPEPGAVNIITGRVVRATFRGSTQRIVLAHASGIELELDVAAGFTPEDTEVQLALRPDQLAIIPAQAPA